MTEGPSNEEKKGRSGNGDRSGNGGNGDIQDIRAEPDDEVDRAGITAFRDI